MVEAEIAQEIGFLFDVRIHQQLAEVFFVFGLRGQIRSVFGERRAEPRV